MKVAIVHDWFVVYAGAERVVEQLLELYPEADLFSTVDFLPDGKRDFIKNKKVHTTFIQHLPGARKHYRSYLPLMPLAIEQLDLSGYDLIISSSSCVAKGVITGPDQIHICMCYTPVRYAWDLQHQYLQEAGMTKGLKSWLARIILHYIRMWDLRTVNNVDHFIAISKYIERRIKKYYRRESTVIYPPVDVDKFELCEKKEDYYLTASRMVPYKKIKLIVEAFNEMPDKKLVVIGDGPEFAKTKDIAKENITMMGYQTYEVLKEKMQHARAFVFAAEEDFGITPLEAQACGTPVIAYGRGGALETIIDSQTGIFFAKQSVNSIVEAIKKFDQLKTITAEKSRANAENFSVMQFRNKIHEYIDGVCK